MPAARSVPRSCLSSSAHRFSSSGASLIDVVQSQLGRELDRLEALVVASLSAEGIAKLNSHDTSAQSLEKVLADLKAAYSGARQRRASLLAQLSNDAKALIGQMGRPPTTCELAFFVAVPFAWIIRKVNQQKPGHLYGPKLCAIIEELATHYKYTQLRVDGQALAETHQLPLTFSPLAPTQCPSVGFDPASPTVARIGSDHIWVGVSPIVCWFKELPAFSSTSGSGSSSSAVIALSSSNFMTNGVPSTHTTSDGPGDQDQIPEHPDDVDDDDATVDCEDNKSCGSSSASSLAVWSFSGASTTQLTPCGSASLVSDVDAKALRRRVSFRLSPPSGD